MSKIIIIGSGPAGISAALYSARAGLETLVISKGEGALITAKKIENYYGVSGDITGLELQKIGVDGAKSLGVKFVDEEVIGASFENDYVVKTNANSYNGDILIIATGTSRNIPKIIGVNDFEGKGVSYCAVCDGFFYRQKDVAVLGSGEYALSEAKELLPLASSVTILTNGEQSTVDIPSEIKVVDKKIKNIYGDSSLSGVEFDDGTKLEIAGLFVALGVAGSTDLARKLGAVIDKNKIVVDEKMTTNIPGVYAAGDCTGGMLQIAKAVYEGAMAGTSAVKYLRSLNK